MRIKMMTLGRRFVVYGCLLFVALQGLAQSPRQTVLFTSDWKFNKGDVPGGESNALDDHGWRQVELPHDWSIEGPFSQQWASGTGFLPGGIGWYRKTFSMNHPGQGKQVFIYFHGWYKNS